MIAVLLYLLPYVAPAIRFADDANRNYWRVHLVAYSFAVWLADMAMAHTVMVPYFGFPQHGERTISDTLERTYKSGDARAIKLALAINKESPGHIKAAA
jgi:hypothetical protein